MYKPLNVSINLIGVIPTRMCIHLGHIYAKFNNANFNILQFSRISTTPYGTLKGFLVYFFAKTVLVFVFILSTFFLNFTLIIL